MIIDKKLTVDLNRIQPHKVIKIHEGDVNSVFLMLTVTQDGASVSLSGLTIKYDATIAGYLAEQDASGSVSNGMIRIPITKNMTALPGTLKIDVKMKSGTEVLYTQTITMIVEKSVIDGSTMIDFDGSSIGGRLHALEDRFPVQTVDIADNAVTAAKILNGSITRSKMDLNSVGVNELISGNVTDDKLAKNAVTTVKIQNGAVTSPKLADEAVNMDKIASGAVTADKIAQNAVTANKLAAGAVTTGKVADGAITADKLADNAVIKVQPISSDEAVVNAAVENNIAYRVSLDGRSNLMFCVNSGTSLRTQYRFDTLGYIKFRTQQKVNDEWQEWSEWMPFASSRNIGDGAVTGSKIADNAVSSAKISNNSVTAAKLSNSAVSTGKIDDEAVTTPKIADSAVTVQKLAPDVSGTFMQLADSIGSMYLAEGLNNGQIFTYYTGRTDAYLKLGSNDYLRFLRDIDLNGKAGIESGTIPSNHAWYTDESQGYTMTGDYTIIGDMCFLRATAYLIQGWERVYYSLPVACAASSTAVGLHENDTFTIATGTQNNISVLEIKQIGSQYMSTGGVVNFTLAYKRR